MKLAGDYKFEAPAAEVWKALLDPVVLAAVMPGCEKLEMVDDAYVGELNIKVGPVQGKFQGKVTLADVVEEQGYTMTVDGRGAPGFVKAKAAVKLTPEGDAETNMTYDADAQVGGRIASVGQRLILEDPAAIPVPPDAPDRRAVERGRRATPAGTHRCRPQRIRKGAQLLAGADRKATK